MIAGQEEHGLEPLELGTDPVEEAIIRGDSDVSKKRKGVGLGGESELVWLAMLNVFGRGNLEMEVTENLDAYSTDVHVERGKGCNVQAVNVHQNSVPKVGNDIFGGQAQDLWCTARTKYLAHAFQMGELLLD